MNHKISPRLAIQHHLRKSVLATISHKIILAVHFIESTVKCVCSWSHYTTFAEIKE